MADIEQQFPARVLVNSIRTVQFSTDIVTYGSGQESANINWLYPLYRFQIPQRDVAENIETISNWFMIAYGRGKKFRVKDWLDYKSSLSVDTAISDTDQVIGEGDGSTVDFQLVKTITLAGETVSRLIKKPVTGTTIVSIDNVSAVNDWSIDDTTGIVTFDADKTSSITNISQASSAVIDFSAAHNLSVDDTFNISGVAGMTEINGQRATVVSVVDPDTVTVDINSSGYTTYSSGGTTHTLPQAGEYVAAGFEFDLKCRFDHDNLDTILNSGKFHSIDSLAIVEVR